MTPNRVNRAHGPTKENFRSMEKMASDGPKWGREELFPTNPDLANILGRTDLDFENFFFFIVCTPNFWISRFPDFQNLAWAGLGLGEARLEPSGPTNVDFI